MDGGRPLYVDGDGNCLFNALSVLSVGSRVLTVELRVRTCLEPKCTSVWIHRMIFGKFRKKQDEECRDLCVTGKISSTWLCRQHPLWCSDG